MTTFSTTHAGFTLIELVVVISILGILTAVALPRFAALQADARIARMNGALASVRSAAALARATQITKNLGPDSAVILEGQSIRMRNGYPRANDIAIAAGLSLVSPADYYLVPNAPADTAVIAPSTNHLNCFISYREAQGINEQPTYDNRNLTLDFCS